MRELTAANMSPHTQQGGRPRRVCVRAPNWVGDAVMATPAFRAIRAQFPGTHVTVVVHRRTKAVLRGMPWFDESIVYSPSGRSAAGEFLRCTRELGRDPYDLGIVMPNSFSSALMFRLAGVRRRVGYARDLRSFLLTDAVPRPSAGRRFRPVYMGDFYLELCRRADAAPRGRDTELPFSDEDAVQADEMLRAQGVQPGRRLVLLSPGAGFGPSKRWPSERFGRLAVLLQAGFDAQVAVIGGPDETPTAAAIRAAAGVPVLDLTSCGVDLHLLKPVVARSALLVTTDSGPRHYGVALGVPTVCLMGPTHPGYSTSGRAHDHVLRVDVSCGPCQRKRCPRDHRCVTDITPEMVLDACRTAVSAQEEQVR